jgi:CopG family transcriptional regulator / antitoxin EndoAI
MYRRINVTLPSQTLELLDQFAHRGDRSRVIDKAVQFYIAQQEKEQLQQQLKEGATCRAERDLNLADDWLMIEEEAWLQSRE